MIALLSRWKLLSGLSVAFLLLGYIGVLKVENAALSADLVIVNHSFATEQGKYLQCSADFTNLKERIASDALVPDDLDGFSPRPDWMLPDF